MLSAFDELSRLDASGAAGADAVLRWLYEMTRAMPLIEAPAAIDVQGYTRTKLHRCASFEVALLHWNPGALTDLHDHGGERCWFSVLDGAMHVENFRRTDDGSTPNYARLMRSGEMLLGIGEIDYRDDGADAHRCVAVGTTRTLHVYARPLSAFNVFDEYAETCTATTTSYDAIYW
jgi:hypothetical protein